MISTGYARTEADYIDKMSASTIRCRFRRQRGMVCADLTCMADDHAAALQAMKVCSPKMIAGCEHRLSRVGRREKLPPQRNEELIPHF